MKAIERKLDLILDALRRQVDQDAIAAAQEECDAAREGGGIGPVAAGKGIALIASPAYCNIHNADRDKCPCGLAGGGLSTGADR